VSDTVCQDGPHDYNEADLEKSPDGTQVVSRRTCKDCGTTRVVVIDIASGDVLSRRYEYP